MGVHTLNNSRAFSCQRLKHTVPIPIPIDTRDLSTYGVGRHYVQAALRKVYAASTGHTTTDFIASSPASIDLSCFLRTPIPIPTTGSVSFTRRLAVEFTYRNDIGRISVKVTVSHLSNILIDFLMERSRYEGMQIPSNYPGSSVMAISLGFNEFKGQ